MDTESASSQQQQLFVVQDAGSLLPQPEELRPQLILDLGAIERFVDLQILDDIVAVKNAAAVLDVAELDGEAVGRGSHLLGRHQQRRRTALLAPTTGRSASAAASSRGVTCSSTHKMLISEKWREWSPAAAEP